MDFKLPQCDGIFNLEKFAFADGCSYNQNDFVTHFPMNQSTSQIQTDFDRIALVSRDGWDHNSHYHDFLLRQLPPHLSSALDIGCGTGAFSRRLAKQCDQVLAIDLSPQMIRLAHERSSQYTNIEFEIADVLTHQFAPESFDCIASIATLHHLPLDEILLKMKRALKPNGALLVLDLFQDNGLSDPSNLLAAPVSIVLRLIKTGRLRSSAEARTAWDEHGKHDSYLTLSQIKNICADILPGAQIRKHLLWRYSIVWTK